MNLDRISQLMDVLVEEDIAELTVTESGVQLFFSRNDASHVAGSNSAPQGSVEVAPPNALPQQDARSAAKNTRQTVSAPTGGTYYASAKEDGDALVHVGDEVTLGSPLCIIEAMKMMNEIQAEYAGRVVEILCKTGETVSTGQPLFAIEPSTHV